MGLQAAQFSTQALLRQSNAVAIHAECDLALFAEIIKEFHEKNVYFVTNVAPKRVYII